MRINQTHYRKNKPHKLNFSNCNFILFFLSILLLSEVACLQGADPACLGNDGRPALVAAVLNGHHDVIPVLVQRDANVNQTSGP